MFFPGVKMILMAEGGNKLERLSGARRIFESAFIILLFISLFLLLALWSHDPADPGWSQTAAPGAQIRNLMGSVGALVADLLFFLLGWGAFLVPLTVIYVGFCLFVRRFNIFDVDFFTLGLRILGYVMMICSTLALVSMNVEHGDFLSGGVAGNILAGVTIGSLGELGASVLFLALLVCSVPLFTGISLLSLCDAVGGLFFAAVYHRAWKERRKAEMQLEANRQSRIFLAEAEEGGEDSGEPTVFDPETGFAVYLRDDAEIRYAGSTSYDDDDYPLLKSEVKERAGSRGGSAAPAASGVGAVSTGAPGGDVAGVPGGTMAGGITGSAAGAAPAGAVAGAVSSGEAASAPGAAGTFSPAPAVAAAAAVSAAPADSGRIMSSGSAAPVSGMALESGEPDRAEPDPWADDLDIPLGDMGRFTSSRSSEPEAAATASAAMRTGRSPDRDGVVTADLPGTSPAVAWSAGAGSAADSAFAGDSSSPDGGSSFDSSDFWTPLEEDSAAGDAPSGRAGENDGADPALWTQDLRSSSGPVPGSSSSAAGTAPDTPPEISFRGLSSGDPEPDFDLSSGDSGFAAAGAENSSGASSASASGGGFSVSFPSRSSLDDGSQQVSRNTGSFAGDDTGNAILAAEAMDLDDIPDFLPPGQKSVLDDDYNSRSLSSGAGPAPVSAAGPAAGAAPGFPGSSGSAGTVRTDDYFTSLHEEITPDLLFRLRGTYNPHDLPSVELLDPVPPKPSRMTQEEIDLLSRMIEEKLSEYRISVTVSGADVGPVITQFHLTLSPGTKVSKLVGIRNDLARVLMVKSVRVVDVIPGTSYVGLEIPNPKRQTVYFRELVDSDNFRSRKDRLTCGLGCDVVGKPQAMNLAKMPHLLVAGTTGSGKSVGVNGMILSMLYKSTPDDLRMILIDPKMLEFSSYEGIPHLLTPVVTDMKDATSAIRWCVGEMERRYRLMSRINVKNFDGYNEKVLLAIRNREPIPDPLWEPTAQLSDKRPYLGKLPYIVLVIDELADMMMQIGKKVEELIARLAQKARAAGIHMIIATQSPRADVLTGIIKSNIPSRMSFTVSSQLESRIIIEQTGAESLLGNGDMLFSPTGSNTPMRIHGAYVSGGEIDRIVDFWKSRGTPEYVDNILDDEVTEENALPSEKTEVQARTAAAGKDELFDQAVRVILETRRASTSVLQTRMGIGYPRASKLIYELEEAGLISQPMNQAGKRKVLIDDSYLEQLEH